MRMTNTKSRPRYIVYTLTAVSIWTVLMVVAGIWMAYRESATTREIAKVEAQTHFNKDHAIRVWAASHGGVYVPVDESTPPSPYLSHLKDRDITTPSGVRLTLLNPSYLLRQVQDHHHSLYGVRSHVASLRPLSPQNAPDPWERRR